MQIISSIFFLFTVLFISHTFIRFQITNQKVNNYISSDRRLSRIFPRFFEIIILLVWHSIILICRQALSLTLGSLARLSGKRHFVDLLRYISFSGITRPPHRWYYLFTLFISSVFLSFSDFLSFFSPICFKYRTFFDSLRQLYIPVSSRSRVFSSFAVFEFLQTIPKNTKMMTSYC